MKGTSTAVSKEKTAPVTQVTKVMRKGKPHEYTELLTKAKTDTGVMMDRAYEIVTDEIQGKAARIYIPKLYAILIKHDYPPKNARQIITTDCEKMWSLSHVSRWMPGGKDETKAKGGKASGKSRKAASKQKLDKFVEEHKKQLPGLANATPEVVQVVSKLGGDKLLDLYGPEHFKEMGERSADKWTKLKEEARTLQLHIETEEHRELVRAFEESLAARANGTGGYTLFIVNGEYNKVEADVNGMSEKSVNK